MKIEDEIMESLVKFAHDQLGSGSGALYKSRGEGAVQKIIDDIVSGKMGEYIAYKTLYDFFPDLVSAPDMAIYKGKKKSFGADLVVNGVNVHVKTQSFTSIKRYGKSWLFQKSDKLISDTDSKDIILFVQVDKSGEAEVDFACRSSDLVGVYGTPKVPSYSHSKKALYFSDIELEEIRVYRDIQIKELLESLF